MPGCKVKRANFAWLLVTRMAPAVLELLPATLNIPAYAHALCMPEHPLGVILLRNSPVSHCSRENSVPWAPEGCMCLSWRPLPPSRTPGARLTAMLCGAQEHPTAPAVLQAVCSRLCRLTVGQSESSCALLSDPPPSTAAAPAAPHPYRLFAVGYAARQLVSRSQVCAMLSNPPMPHGLLPLPLLWRAHAQQPFQCSTCSWPCRLAKVSSSSTSSSSSIDRQKQ